MTTQTPQTILVPGGPANPCRPCMIAKCLHCQRKISYKDGLFFYLEAPWFGALHRDCAPFWSFPNQWPHPQPVLWYMNMSNNSGGQCGGGIGYASPLYSSLAPGASTPPSSSAPKYM